MDPGRIGTKILEFVSNSMVARILHVMAILSVENIPGDPLGKGAAPVLPFIMPAGLA